MTAPCTTAAPNVLVVEDRGIIADKVRRTLEREGFCVVGLLASVQAALEWIGHDIVRLDAAVLDIDLRGVAAYPVAEALAARGVPFVFLTGYGQIAIAPAWQDRPRVEKPFDTATLVQTLRTALRRDARVVSSSREPVITEAVQRAWDTMRETRNIITEARAVRETLGLPAASR